MSFVSVAGNKNYINIVCDGRALLSDGTIEDDWVKFKIINEDKFIAFAGTVHTCFEVIDYAFEIKDLDYNIWEEKVRDKTINMPYDDMTSKAMICVGGRENGLKISSFSNKSLQEVQKFDLTTTDISYVFLSNIDKELDLDAEFMKCARRYKSLKSRDILQAQKELNNIVSDVNSLQVNKNITHFTMKK